MSHNFKRPTSIDPRERQAERRVKVMALQVHDQETLDKLLEGSTPVMRDAMLERIAPYLDFMPAEYAIADCPGCGMHNGSVIAHQCEEQSAAIS